MSKYKRDISDDLKELRDIKNFLWRKGFNTQSNILGRIIDKLEGLA